MPNGIKLLLTGLSNSGKTNALKTLDPKASLVINIDGKSFPLAIPHANYQSFPDIESLISGWETDGEHIAGIVDVMKSFKDATGAYPKTVVIDTVSRVFQIIADNCNTKYKNFDIHSNIAKQIAMFNNFLQEQLVMNGMNVVSTTHVTFDETLNAYVDASSGAYKKAGGAISVHDHVAFFQVKGKKYVVSHRVPGLPCRTLLTPEQIPDTQSADEYSLANHIKLLEDSTTEITKFTLN